MNVLKTATALLKPLETSSSLGLFARDTGGCLISRLSLSRSEQERKEVSMAEISESAIFYFAAPILAKLFGNIYSKLPIKSDVSKTSQFLSVFALILPLVYLIAPIRNLMTLKDTGKDEFISVVGLKKDNENTKENLKNNDAKTKMLNLIKKAGLFTAGAALSTIALIASSKNEKIYKKIEPIIKKINEHFSFNKDGDLKLLHYAVLIYPASILGYFKASRDKYEVMENIRRFSISVPLLFLGDKIIEKPIYKFFDKKFNTSVTDKNNIKSYEDILKLPKEKQNQFLKAKNFSFGLNFLASTMLVAAGITLLNRIQTKRNYEKDNNLNKNV